MQSRLCPWWLAQILTMWVLTDKTSWARRQYLLSQNDGRLRVDNWNTATPKLDTWNDLKKSSLKIILCLGSFQPEAQLRMRSLRPHVFRNFFWIGSPKMLQKACDMWNLPHLRTEISLEPRSRSGTKSANRCGRLRYGERTARRVCKPGSGL